MFQAKKIVILQKCSYFSQLIHKHIHTDDFGNGRRIGLVVFL